MASGGGKAKEGFHAQTNGVTIEGSAQEGTPKAYEQYLTLTCVRIGTHTNQHSHQQACPALLETPTTINHTASSRQTMQLKRRLTLRRHPTMHPVRCLPDRQ